MRTIQTTATILPDGAIIARGPTDLTPGEHAVVIVVATPLSNDPRPPQPLPIIDVGPWPEGLSLRREDMYGDDDR